MCVRVVKNAGRRVRGGREKRRVSPRSAARLCAPPPPLKQNTLLRLGAVVHARLCVDTRRPPPNPAHRDHPPPPSLARRSSPLCFLPIVAPQVSATPSRQTRVEQARVPARARPAGQHGGGAWPPQEQRHKDTQRASADEGGRGGQGARVWSGRGRAESNNVSVAAASKTKDRESAKRRGGGVEGGGARWWRVGALSPRRARTKTGKGVRFRKKNWEGRVFSGCVCRKGDVLVS